MSTESQTRPSFETAALNLSLTGAVMSPRAAWNLAVEAIAREFTSDCYTEEIVPHPQILGDLIREFHAPDVLGATGNTPDVGAAFRALMNAVLLTIDNRDRLIIRSEDEEADAMKAQDMISRAFLDVFAALCLVPDHSPGSKN